MDDLETDAQRALRFKAWLEQFRFSPRDWARIKALAEAVDDNTIPAGLQDLDAPFRVQALPASHRNRGWSSGRTLGFHKGRVLVWWPLEGRDREAWARRR